jgi:hypothetical protein
VADMSTTHSILITCTSDLRRLRLRSEKGMNPAEEIAATLTNPQFGWAQDFLCLPPTDAQWREIGKINGLTIR